MSGDNYKNRPPEDIQYLFNAMKDNIVNLKNDNVRVKVWGDWKSVHDTDLVNVITDVIDTTKNYVKTTLHLLFNWITTDDGRSTEIPDINLLIRTGGYHRLSGFIPYKCAYAELLFIDKLFPDCTEKDWEEALIWYEHQEQHFGA
jgi:undecaprenyl pyrophosphate synthase